VEGQPFFTSIAGLAVSLAGFGAVIAWLRDDPSGWDPVNLWRVKTIVRHALTIAFLCLTLVPIHTFTQDDATTIRIGSALGALFLAPTCGGSETRIRWCGNPTRRGASSWRRRGWSPCWEWSTSPGRALLQALILAVLTSPAGIFSNFVREMGRRSGGRPAEPSGIDAPE
jgi:hypothetical protein